MLTHAHTHILKPQVAGEGGARCPSNLVPLTNNEVCRSLLPFALLARLFVLAVQFLLTRAVGAVRLWQSRRGSGIGLPTTADTAAGESVPAFATREPARGYYAGHALVTTAAPPERPPCHCAHLFLGMLRLCSSLLLCGGGLLLYGGGLLLCGGGGLRRCRGR